MSLSMTIRTNGANTFIVLSGEIRSEGAGQLAEAVRQYGKANGRCFIATDGAAACDADVRSVLHSKLRQYGVELSALYFKGRYAFDLAPDGCRVLVMKSPEKQDAHGVAEKRQHCRRPGCTGDCAHCPRCQGKRH